MAAYNQWQNETLYALCADMEDGERKRDRRMFFRSIHDTLDHILLIDELIFAYVEDGTRPKMDASRRHDDFEALRAARVACDARLCQRAATMTAEWLLEPLPTPGGRNAPRGFMLTQMFNHQTHHRSQITTHLHLMDIDYGSTDMPFNPHSTF
ncbi:MAG: DinB family protein [Myxococcota bacterium]